MARTKQIGRVSTGGRAADFRPCYWDSQPEVPISPSRRQVQGHRGSVASARVMTNFDTPKVFPQFMKLPLELRRMIFEAMAKEARVVSVHSVAEEGLRSRPPPVLHVCSESRAIALKHYSLAFNLWDEEEQGGTVCPGTYFNFDRDTLYLREGWNKFAEGERCCLSYLQEFLQDVERVKKLGIDVDAKVCGGRYSSHKPELSFWDGLQTLYIGCEDTGLAAECPITMRGLEGEEYGEFRRRYERNPCWETHLEDGADDAEFIERLRSNGASTYRHDSDFDSGSEEMKPLKLEPVRIGHL